MSKTIDHQIRISSILSNCPGLRGLHEEEVLSLSEACLYRVYNTGKKVLTVDHEGSYIFVVGRGRLSLKLKNGKRKEFGEGELFGEIAVISNKGRLGTITCEEDSEIVAIHKNVILEGDQLSIELRYKLMCALANKMIAYFYNTIPSATEELIEKGEGESLEYKLSMSQPIIVPIIRAISAFMNCKGGTILVGVRDNGEIVGIRDDKTEIDRFQQAIYSKVKSRLGGQHLATLVSFDLEKIEGKLLLRIDIDASDSPVFFKKYVNEEERELFIVRTGCLNTTIKRTSEIIDYVQQNFKVKNYINRSLIPGI